MKTLILLILCSVSAQAKNTYQVSFVGITHHGTQVSPSEPKKMLNKLSGDGVWAYNPQYNFTRIREGGELLNVSFVVDCYRSAALNVALGKRFDYSDRLKYGYIYGIYFRSAPGNKNNFQFKATDNHQLFPTAAGVLQYKISDRIVLRLTANYVINFFDVAFEF